MPSSLLLLLPLPLPLPLPLRRSTCISDRLYLFISPLREPERSPTIFLSLRLTQNNPTYLCPVHCLLPCTLTTFRTAYLLTNEPTLPMILFRILILSPTLNHFYIHSSIGSYCKYFYTTLSIDRGNTIRLQIRCKLSELSTDFATVNRNSRPPDSDNSKISPTLTLAHLPWLPSN